MAKRCRHGEGDERCKNNVFAFSYCPMHQTDRTDSTYIRQQSAIKEKKQIKIAKVIEQQKEQRRKRPRINRNTNHVNAEIVCSTKDGRVTELFSSEYGLFKYIWDNNDHISFLSGLPINISEGCDLWFSIFSHVLSKAQNRYPLYKLYEKNVIMILPIEHNLLDQGTIAQRTRYAEKTGCSWNKITVLADELKQCYPNIS